MARAILKNPALNHVCWLLAVQCATYLKNRAPCSASGDRTPYDTGFGYVLDLSNFRMFGSQVLAFVPLQEHKAKLADHTRARRYIGHDDSGTTCIILDETTNRLYRRGRAEVFQCLDVAQQHMNLVPEGCLCDNSFIDDGIETPKPFWERVPGDNHVTIKGHAAWHKEDDHETVSVLKVITARFPMVAWSVARIFVIFQVCADTAWASATRAMAYDHASCGLDNFHPLMTNVTVSAGCYGMVEGCVIVSVH